MTSPISRDVITDLLPVYFSGEASADTKSLVENFMQSDPEFAKLVKNESRVEFTAKAGAAPDQEMVSLRRAKRKLRRKAWFLAWAIFFSFLTFIVSIEDTGITWSWQISPLLTLGFAVVAAWFWTAYVRTNRASRSLGI